MRCSNLPVSEAVLQYCRSCGRVLHGRHRADLLRIFWSFRQANDGGCRQRERCCALFGAAHMSCSSFSQTECSRHAQQLCQKVYVLQPSSHGDCSLGALPSLRPESKIGHNMKIHSKHCRHLHMRRTADLTRQGERCYGAKASTASLDVPAH